MDLAKTLHSAGQGFVLEAKVLKTAKQAMLLGVETVGVTYALFKLTREIPQSSLMFERRQKVDELKAPVAARGTRKGPSLERLATQLITVKT